MDESKVTQWMVDQLVKPENQYRDAVSPPLDNIRMAWPFKTEAELVALSKWFRTQDRAIKDKQLKEHVEQYGDAFL